MKTRIKKIIMIATALIFVSAGVSFAQDWNDRNHKPPGKAYAYYQVKKLSPGWANKNFRPNLPITKRYVYKEVRDYRYYDDHYQRPTPRRDAVYKVVEKDPIVVFKIIVRDHR